MESSPEHNWKHLVTRLLNRRVVTREPVVSQTCPHPPESVVNGANQYGSWQRCLLCQTKISYVPHRAKPPVKAGKKAVAYTSQPPAVTLERREAAATSKERNTEIVETLGKVMAESTHQLQVAMAQCNQQVLTGMAQSNQQVMTGMGTMIQTMQAMQATQQGMMQEVRGLTAEGLSPQWVADQLADWRLEGHERKWPVNCEKGGGEEDRERLQRGAGDFFSVDAGRLTRQAVPDLFWEKGGMLGLEGNSSPHGPRLVARWRVPALSEHLDNLDLEGEPDGGLTAKEQKKVRRAARKLLETHAQPRPAPRRPLVFVLAEAREHLDGTTRENLNAEMVHFDIGGWWDLCRQRHRDALWAMVRRFQPSLLVASSRDRPPGEGGPREQVRPGGSGEQRSTAIVTATALEENTEAPVLAVEMGGVQVITNDAGVVAAGALGDGGLTAIVGGYGPLRSATLHLNYHNDEEEGTEARAEESEQPEADDDGADGGAAGVGAFPPEGDEDTWWEAVGGGKEMAKLVTKLHENMGHLSADRMIVMLKAAGARDEVLEYVRKEFACELCGKRQREVQRRVAAFPRTFTFNRIVAVDTFYVPWQGTSVPIMNIVDHGTHYQVAVPIKELDGSPHRGGTPRSEEAWRAFCDAWVRPYGCPEIVISDAGPEFLADFSKGLELHSVLQHLTDAESPWQNGIAERHGGEIKRRVLRELSEGQTVLRSRGDLELLLVHLTSCKNQWYTRAGYLRAAVGPRGPRAFAQACQIRQRARELMFEKEAREKLQRAARAPRHVDQQYAPGEWVYVFRRGPLRAGWSAPGLVLLHHGTTVWVAMRARLWKCNVDQVRPASSTEALGVEVVNSLQYQDLPKNLGGKRAGAVDEPSRPPPGPIGGRGDCGDQWPDELRSDLETIVNGLIEEEDLDTGGAHRQASSSVDLTPRERLSLEERVEELREARADREGPGDDHLYGTEPSFFALATNSDGAPTLVACRNDEFDVRKATVEETKGFAESDRTEWNSVTGMNAVRVWRGRDVQELRRQYAGRILRSRMVRRKKPMPGVGNFKYKSRWCVLGFDDPDSEVLRTFAPTPQAEIINLFFQTALNLKLNVVFGDVTSAFCQGKKLQREAGRLFAEPCAGIDAEPGDLVELLVAVYGLEDAPVCWAETDSRRPPAERTQAMILLEVDDFNIAAQPSYEEELLEKLRQRFVFGKWLRGEADFNGRRVRITDTDVFMHQEKYVLEKLKAIELSKNRRAQKDSPLLEGELEAFRSMLCRVSWLSHHDRRQRA
eukprot:s466_g11.t1